MPNPHPQDDWKDEFGEFSKDDIGVLVSFMSSNYCTGAIWDWIHTMIYDGMVEKDILTKIREEDEFVLYCRITGTDLDDYVKEAIQNALDLKEM